MRKKYRPRNSIATSASSSTVSSSDNVDSIDGESIEESLLDDWDEWMIDDSDKENDSDNEEL